jgi:hypothetical protein
MRCQSDPYPTTWFSSPAGISPIVEVSSILKSGCLFAASTLPLATKLHFLQCDVHSAKLEVVIFDLASAVSGRGAYMLRARRTGDGQVLFTVSGRIETEDIKQLQQLLAVEPFGKQLSMDLRDVTLVNQDAVKFLTRCEADGIKLENCPLHVRKWIDELGHRPGEDGHDKD